MFVPNLSNIRGSRNKRGEPIPLNFSSKQSTPNFLGCVDRPILIYHTCDQSSHYSPDGKVSALLESEIIIRNIDLLYADDHAHILDTSCSRVKVLIDFNTAKQLKK